MLSPREKVLSEKRTLKRRRLSQETKNEQRDTKKNGSVGHRSQGRKGSRERDQIGQMLGTLSLDKAQDLQTTLIYSIQAADIEYCLWLLCFMVPILMTLKNRNNLFIHLDIQ